MGSEDLSTEDVRLRDHEARDVAQGLGSFMREKGLLGALTSGNISVSTLSGFVITAKGANLGELHRADFASIERREVIGEPSTEIGLHRAARAYCRYPREVVVHTHSPWVVAASLYPGDRLPFVHYHQVLLGECSTPVVPFDIPGSKELAAKVTHAFHSNPTRVVILANHGALVCAKDEYEMMALLEVLEECCRLVALSSDLTRRLSGSYFEPLRQMFEDYLR